MNTKRTAMAWGQAIATMTAVILLAITMTTMAGAAQAQGFPSKPIRVVVPFPAGGGTDILARALAQKLAEARNWQLIVDNRPGAGANIGAEVVARSAPDGYTLFMASTIHSINRSLYPKLGYDLVKDFTPIALTAEIAQVLVVHQSVPAHSVEELIAEARKRPHPFLYSSAGNGSQPHLAAELFRTMTGIQLSHVPYKGAPPAMVDLIAGHVALSFASTPTAVPNVKSGKVRALGVSSEKRIAALPNVPTIAEAGVPGYNANGFFGLMGPAGLPRDIVATINAAIVEVMKDPALRKALDEQGYEPLSSTPEEYSAFLNQEIEKWAKVVRESGAKID